MTPDSNNTLITDWRLICRHYLLGWFLLDLIALSSSAFDILPLALTSAGDLAERGEKSPLAAFRIVRILRLSKLIRLVRASKRLKELSVKVATPRAILTIFTTLIECVLVIHYGACVLGLVTIIPDSPLDTWRATHGYCRPAGFGENGTRIAECTSPAFTWFQCIWWSTGMLMGGARTVHAFKPAVGARDEALVNAEAGPVTNRCSVLPRCAACRISCGQRRSHSRRTRAPMRATF